MADYSIDDILAELDAKKSGDSDNTGRSYGDDTPPRHHDISATAIIEGLDGSEDGVYLREKDGGTENVDAEYINEAQDGSDEVSIATSYESRKDNGSTDNSDIDKITGEQSDVDKVLGETDNFMITDASSEIDIDEHKAKVLAENEKAVQGKPAENEKATCYVKQAVEYMAGRIPVCCVVGFPLGAMDTASKAFEAKTAIENGAAEVDMVINIGRLKNGEYDAVREDIRAVKQAVGDKILKVIIETCLLTDDEKRKMCDIVCEAGADYIKTSTGFSTAGANFHDVELMVKGVAGRCKVKAAGGISTVDDMEKFLALGADRLGTSRAVKILNGEQAKGY